MKRFLRFLLFVAVVAAVVWATRERMLPTPPPPVSEPPPFRHPPEPPRATAEAEPASPQPEPEAAPAETPSPAQADDLQRVKGIGPVYEAKLIEHGITTFPALIGADSEELAEALDVSVSAIVDWKTQATEFLG